MNLRGGNIYFIEGDYRRRLEQFKTACMSIKKDIVVQELINQNETISAINPTSINTVRILSLLTQSDVKIYSSILRMGVDGNRVDNISQGGIACGISRNGVLKKCAYNYRGDRYYKHPTTGIEFNNIKIPNYNEIVNLVKKAHPAIPKFRLVSWDIVLDNNTMPLLLEAILCYGELNLHQLCNGAIFGNDTEDVLEEIFVR